MPCSSPENVTERGPVPQWRRISSRNGDLPVPGASREQTAAVVFDADGDRRDEFMLAFRQIGPALVWYRPSGTGWKRFVVEPETLTIEAGGAVADIDGDGDLDVVFGGDWQSNRVWWWENPSPRFDPEVPWKRHEIKVDGANQHHDQLFGDFDGDGKPELIFWNQAARRLFRAKIPKDPKAGPWPFVEIFAGDGEGLAMGDIDGDGQPELLAGGRWFRYAGGDDFESYAIDPEQTHPRMAVGDLNGDGRLEVVMVPGDEAGPLKWYECRGDPRDVRSWVGHMLLDRDLIHAHSLAVADIDGDGHLDIFCGEMAKWTEKAVRPDHPGATTWVLYGDGKGRFHPSVVMTGCGIHEGRVADLNGDGRLDLLAKPYNWDAPRIDLYLQEPVAEKTARADFPGAPSE